MLTIKEALEQLRIVIPATERSICITSEVMDYEHYPVGDPKRLRVSFRIWDGNTSHDGPTLEIALQKCLLANVPDRGNIENAEALVSEALSMQSIVTEASA